jgi:hypothetical protein
MAVFRERLGPGEVAGFITIASVLFIALQEEEHTNGPIPEPVKRILYINSVFNSQSGVFYSKKGFQPESPFLIAVANIILGYS